MTPVTTGVKMLMAQRPGLELFLMAEQFIEPATFNLPANLL